MLPSGYTYLHGLVGNGAYIDTGVMATELTNVACLFSTATSEATGYIFGARNTNSNTSAGQLNFYVGASGSADQFGWRSARISQTIPTSVASSIYNYYFTNDGLTGTLLGESQYRSRFKGAEGTFTGTRNLYLFGLNNAGSLTACSNPVKMYGFKIWQDGTLVRNFIPCVDSNNTLGMYDDVNGVFYGSANSTSFDTNIHNVSITSNTGGKGYANINGERFTSFKYQLSVSTLLMTSSVTLEANPQKGYVFKNWTMNGSVLSTEKTYKLTLSRTSDYSIECNFVKETELDLKTGYKAVAFKYDDNNGLKSATYFEVTNFSINEDYLQKATSTLTVKNVPSSAQINTPLFLYDPKGRIVYYGLIKAINGNELTCREPIAIFDDEYLLSTDLYNSHRNPVGYMNELIEIGTQNYFVRAKVSDFSSKVNVDMNIDPGKNLLVKMPKIENSAVSNREDDIISLYSEFGVAPSYYLDGTKMGISIVYPMLYDTLVLGDNSEIISDISIDTQEAEATVVDIYDSTGATLRGSWGMDAEGNIKDITIFSASDNPSEYIAYKICKLKTVMSDDDEEDTIARQTLNSSLYSHKITFTLDLTGMIKFSDLKLGQPVKFYYGNQIFNSRITSWSYALENDQIKTMRITLGDVRTSLTSKLNLKKVNRASNR